MKMYDHEDTNLYVSTNGILSLLSGTISYQDGELPLESTQSEGYGFFPDNDIFAFFDDLYVKQGSHHGVYYKIINDNSINDNIIIIEYIMTAAKGNDASHFTLEYSARHPGMFIIKYYYIQDSGSSATVGA
ncbi:hypothetical protein B0H17DRAFT_1186065 [Mycena rosella]|uniref:Uncharacterized protein n=1 Tax=Mycena rosella TaxID=1033263 RepID=A0AAD7CPG5_MYCRO|nr:hypothetical protein B0H17DRAFT_1186065 [Mycena rosella]